MTEKNRVDRYLDTLKNNRIIAIIVVLSLLVVGIGAFTESITRTFFFVKKMLPSNDFVLSW
jgi:hypothetical protein